MTGGKKDEINPRGHAKIKGIFGRRKFGKTFIKKTIDYFVYPFTIF